MSKMKTSQLISLVLFVVVTVLSVYIPYSLMSTQPPNLMFFSSFYIRYSIIVLPILVVWLGLLLAKHKWSDVIIYSREMIVFTAIFLVMTFGLFKWTVAINSYGIYGHPIKNAFGYEQFQKEIMLRDMSHFEQEVIYGDMMKEAVDVEIEKIWTFGAFVFISAFLLLVIMPKKNQ